MTGDATEGHTISTLRALFEKAGKTVEVYDIDQVGPWDYSRGTHAAKLLEWRAESLKNETADIVIISI